MTRFRKQAEKIASIFGDISEWDDEVIDSVESALIAAYNAGVTASVDIVDNELENESDLDDDFRGHLKSMHLGAMDALRAVHEGIRQLKIKQVKGGK